MTHKKYLLYSKNTLTSFLVLFPLLILYELIFLILFHDSNIQIRNSADVILRNFIFFLRNSSQFTYLIFLITLFIAYFFTNYKSYKNYKFNLYYNIMIFLESFILSLILLFLLNGFNIYNGSYNLVYDNVLLHFYFCLGAGIWEEFIFRLIIFNVIFYIFKFIIPLNMSCILSIVFSSIIFSIFHYTGNMAYDFNYLSFLIRFVGGVSLCLIYIYRGIGISSLTHCFYDILLLILTII